MYIHDGEINLISILVLSTLVYFIACFVHMLWPSYVLVRLDLIMEISLSLADTLE